MQKQSYTEIEQELYLTLDGQQLVTAHLCFAQACCPVVSAFCLLASLVQGEVDLAMKHRGNLTKVWHIGGAGAAAGSWQDARSRRHPGSPAGGQAAP